MGALAHRLLKTLVRPLRVHRETGPGHIRYAQWHRGQAQLRTSAHQNGI